MSIKNYVVTVEIDLGDSSEEDALGRVKRIPFGNNDCGFRIMGIREGQIPPGEDLAALPEIRDNQNEGDIFIQLVGGPD